MMIVMPPSQQVHVRYSELAGRRWPQTKCIDPKGFLEKKMSEALSKLNVHFLHLANNLTEILGLKFDFS